MEPLSTGTIIAIAINSINTIVNLYRKAVPSHQQKALEKWDYLKDRYELELNKMPYDPHKTDEENKNARDNDLLLNLRDKLLRYGEALTKQLASAKSKE